MLELSGEIGYRSTVAQLGEVEDLFADAYEAEAEALCTAMLDAAAAAGDWRGGTRAAVKTLLRFAAERPALASALLCEVHVVGGRALAKHEEVLERLTAAIEGGCALPADRVSTVPRAPSFVVGAVEGVVAGRLSRGETDDLPSLEPELMYLIVASFLGRAAAEDEI